METNNNLFICKECNLTYATRAGIWKHNAKYHHSILENKTTESSENVKKIPNYICKYCKKNFTKKFNLQRHRKNCKDKNENKEENKEELELLKNTINNMNKTQEEMVKEIFELKKYKNEILGLKESIKELKNIQKETINNQLINIIVDRTNAYKELQSRQNNIIQPINTEPIQEDVNNITEPSSLILNNVVIISRIEDNYINATQLCKAGNKKFNHWFSLDTTKELINKLSNKLFNENETVPDTGITASGSYSLIEINKGGNDKNNQETWIHPKLAIQLAQWISADFALQVSDWILNLFSNGKVEVNIKMLKNQNKELKVKDQRIQLLQDMCLKKQQRKKYPEKNVIYMVSTEDNKKKRIYIIGKAKDLKDRLSIYNKTAEHEVVYYKDCEDEEIMNLTEGMVLKKLDQYREKANRDRFILPLENNISLFTNIIDESIDFFKK